MLQAVMSEVPVDFCLRWRMILLSSVVVVMGGMVGSRMSML